MSSKKVPPLKQIYKPNKHKTRKKEKKEKPINTQNLISTTQKPHKTKNPFQDNGIMHMKHLHLP